MPVRKELFTKSALEKLSSPEQLDVLMRVTDPKGWIALVAVGFLLFAAVIWGIFGRIPTTVDGQGILIRGGAVLDIESGTAGRVTEFKVESGDLVKVGQVIATIGQGGQAMKVGNLEEHLQELEQQHVQQTAAERSNAQTALQALNEERENRKEAAKDLDAQVDSLMEKVANQETLLSKGLATKTSVISTRSALFAAQEKVSQNQIRLTQIIGEEGTIRKDLQERFATRQRQIDDIKRELTEMRSQLESSSQVLSPYEGRVLQRMVDRGELVTPQTRLVSLETLTEPLDAVLFIPARDGKKVQPGMEVQISPSTVRREEYGVMIGKVKSVSTFPTTPDAMQRILRNAALAQELAGGGAPLEVTAELLSDPNTQSGYKWSSPMGPPIGVYSGTLASASIVVDRKRPIGYVIPLVKETLGGQ